MTLSTGAPDHRFSRRQALEQGLAWSTASLAFVASPASSQSPGAVGGHNLGKFAFPLEYGPDEKEGEGFLSPGNSPGVRVLALARQVMELKVLGANKKQMHVRALVPCLRNVGEQRRLASRVTVRASAQVLAHEAKLVYTLPFQNPFWQVDFESESGVLEIEIDSWLSHAAPPVDATKAVKTLLLKPPEGAKVLAAFAERHRLPPSPHWWIDDSGKLPPKPLAAGVEGGAGLKTVHNVLKATAGKVPHDPHRSVTAPDEALQGGDSIAQASFNWYCLQSELWTALAAGFSRQHVLASYTALHAWNLLSYKGLLVGDSSGGTPYLGPDNVNFLATSVGSDHEMPQISAIKRHHPYNGGMWLNQDGEIDCTRLASLAGISAMGRLQRNGRVVISTAAGEAAKGVQQAELNALTAEPPPGVAELAGRVDALRKRGG